MRGAFERRLAAMAIPLALAAPASAQIDFGARGQAQQAVSAAALATSAAAQALAQQANGNTMPNVYGRTAANLRNLTACLAKMRLPGSTQHCLIAEIGDSKTKGTGAGTGLDASSIKNAGAAGRNRTYFEALAFADRGYGVQRQSWCGIGYPNVTSELGFDPRRAIGASWTTSGAGTLGGAMAYLNSPYTTAETFAPDAAAPIDSVTVWANSGTGGQAGTAGPGFSQFSVTDGTTATTFDGSQASALVRKFTATFAARAAGKTISVARINNNGGQFMPVCVMASDSTVPAIDLINMGHHGSTTATWNNANGYTYNPIPALKAMAPVATIVQLYTNDPGSGISTATTIANLQAIWTAAKLSGDCIVLLPTRPGTTKSTYAAEMALEAPVKAAALAGGCMVVALGERGGDYATASTLGLTDDGVSHESAAGYAAEARAIVDALIG